MIDPALLRLLQLASPALPVGGFAYSDSLETAVDRGWVAGEDDALAWIRGRLRHPWARVDLPILARLRAGVDVDDWAARLRASRDSREARTADRQLGQALARLLADLDVADAAAWRTAPTASLAVGFALAGRAWQIPTESLLAGYAWTLCDSQVAAAIKLVPLGQTAGQRILSTLGAEIPATCAFALELGDDEIGACAPAVALAGAWHERQQVRLFRS